MYIYQQVALHILAFYEDKTERKKRETRLPHMNILYHLYLIFDHIYTKKTKSIAEKYCCLSYYSSDVGDVST